MKIKIWSQDNSDEENADELELSVLFYVQDPSLNEIVVDSAIERAVLEYAEKDHPHSDYWENAVFCVRLGDELRIYDVEARMEQNFYAAKRKQKATA